ncbi:MAG: DUF2568 domain-containing protein [Antricoccus sp.]
MAKQSTALSIDSLAGPSAKPDQSPSLDTTGDWIFGTAAFAVEIALAVGAAMIGYRYVVARGSAIWAAIAAVIALALLVSIWATWMAPNADHRLGLAGRLILGTALILIVAAGLIGTGANTFGWTLGAVGIVVTLAAQVAIS